MTWFKNIVLNICVLSVVYTLILILTPNKYTKQIKTVMAIIYALIISANLINFNLSDFELNDINYNIEYDNTNDENLLINEIETRIEEYILNELNRLGYIIENVEVITYIDDEMCISISEVKVMLNNKNTNADDAIIRTIIDMIGEVNVTVEG